MIIKFKHFTLQPGQTAKDRWDVLRTMPITMNNTPRMKSKYPKAKIGDIVGTKEEEIAYDMQLENAVMKAISYLLAENEDVTDLRGFLRSYREQKNELGSMIK